MCGIAGVAYWSSETVDPSLARRLSDSLEHRGPDDLGFLGWDGNGGLDRGGASNGSLNQGREPSVVARKSLALVHRRLSIIDLTPRGWQPMSAPDGSLHLVFNGEVYNYVELRDELRQKGVSFASETDTEVVLQAYAHWGAAAFQRFVGMFALAILDIPAKQLVLARDFFGIKPLYYSELEGGGLAFASEVKTLLEVPQVSRRVSAQTYFDYIRFGRTDGAAQTMFDSIRQLLPGELATVDLTGKTPMRVSRYWELSSELRSDLSRKQAVEAVRETFLENVKLHLRSDVPIGSCLSGGIDSSAIVMAVRHLLGKDAEIHTFSYIPIDTRLSEERWIDLVNERANAISHKIRPESEGLRRDLDRLIQTQDGPFSGTSIYAQYRVFELVHQHGVKVMLDGQGADELLGGYQGISRVARLASMLQQRQLFRALRFSLRVAWSCDDVPIDDFLKKGYVRAADMLRRGNNGSRGSAPVSLAGPSWLDMHWFAERDVKVIDQLRSFYDRESLRTYLVQATQTTSLPHLLRYEDRNSMRFSIESRVPFLTPKFAELMLSLPEEFLVDNKAVAKSIFREAMRGIVPDEILDRRDKVGFTTPIRDWLVSLRGWVEEILDSEMAHSIPGVDLPAIRAAWDEVTGGRDDLPPHIWRFVNLVRWCEGFQPVFAS